MFRVLSRISGVVKEKMKFCQSFREFCNFSYKYQNLQFASSLDVYYDIKLNVQDRRAVLSLLKLSERWPCHVWQVLRQIWVGVGVSKSIPLPLSERSPA